MTPVRIGRKLRLVAGEVWRRPVPTATVGRAVLESQGMRWTSGIAREVQWTVTQRLMMSARGRPGIHLFDEGVLQALWSIGLRGTVAPALLVLEEQIGSWAKPDLVLVVHARIEELVSRLAARASRHSRIQQMDDPRALARELERGQELLLRLLRWWSEIVGGGVIELRNDPEREWADLAPRLAGMIASEARRASPVP
jgi:hypothetical protein